jgi:hypothetical protein
VDVLTHAHVVSGPGPPHGMLMPLGSDKEFDAMNNALIAMPCSRLHTASLQRYKVIAELVLFETSDLPQSRAPHLWSSSSSIYWHSNLVASADWLRMLAHVHTLTTTYLAKVDRHINTHLDRQTHTHTGREQEEERRTCVCARVSRRRISHTQCYTHTHLDRQTHTHLDRHHHHSDRQIHT